MALKRIFEHALTAAILTAVVLIGVNQMWRFPTGLDAQGFYVTTGAVLHFLDAAPVALLLAAVALFLAAWFWLSYERSA